MVKIKERTKGNVKVVAEGQDLKHACNVWEARRNNNDDLFEAFKKSKYFTQDFDFDEVDNAYEQFIDSLSGEEMFDIMRDGVYNWYE